MYNFSIVIIEFRNIKIVPAAICENISDMWFINKAATIVLIVSRSIIKILHAYKNGINI